MNGHKLFKIYITDRNVQNRYLTSARGKTAYTAIKKARIRFNLDRNVEVYALCD